MKTDMYSTDRPLALQSQSVFPAVFPLQVKPDEHLPTGLASNQH
jgi:hypothetical protein